ncbi:XRE family transcriptional regulator [Acutalibacter sp. 1XD8-33]|nr:XRE family transcriptional regulator [Acutalibacter sp. 1XD8-33]
MRKFRKLQNISQEALAEKTGCSPRYISALENGQKDNPSAAFLFQCSAALDVPVEALMDLKGQSPTRNKE